MAKWKDTKTTGLKQDPKKALEWQQRSQARAIEKMRQQGQKLAPREIGRKKPQLPAGSVSGLTTRKAHTSAARSVTQPSPAGKQPTGSGVPVLAPQMRSQNRKRPQNDGPWRAECIAARGEWCRCCGKQPVQMDHICPKGQGGKSHVGNGLPLCEEHHRMKTDSEILIEWAWLDPDQHQYLASIGWVDWDEEGQPFGRGYKHFGTRPPRPGL